MQHQKACLWVVFDLVLFIVEQLVVRRREQGISWRADAKYSSSENAIVRTSFILLLGISILA